MAPSTTLERRTAEVRPMLPALLAAAVALTLSSTIPLLSPLLVALVIGAVVANSRSGDAAVLRGQASSTKLLLRLGIVLLGLRLPVTDVLAVGPGALVVVLVTVPVTYAATVHVGDRLGLDRGFVTLMAAGFSICGAAAIAAVDEAVRAKEQLVALAVAMVTVFGSLMIVSVPVLGRLLGLTETQIAVWTGASIHEVAQVIAAASLVGTSALAVATTVKLARVTLLAPAYAVSARRTGRVGVRRSAMVPWFVTGFAAAVAVRSLDVLPPSVLDVSSTTTTLLLGAGMFGLGLGIRAKDLWPVPRAAFLLACLSTSVAAGTSLLLVLVLA